MCTLKNLKLIFKFSIIGVALLFSCKQEDKNTVKTRLDEGSHIDIKAMKAWPEISKYIMRYKKMSDVFRLQVINDEKAAKLQISYLLKQNEVLNRPPAYYVNVDNSLILVYDGMEEYLESPKTVKNLKDEILFKRLIFEADSSFLIYHSPVWEFTREGQNIKIDTSAKSFNYKHLDMFVPPAIE